MTPARKKKKNAQEPPVPLVTLAQMKKDNEEATEPFKNALTFSGLGTLLQLYAGMVNFIKLRTGQINALLAEVESLSGILASFKELDEDANKPQTDCHSTQTSPPPCLKETSSQTDPTKPATPAATKRKQPEAPNPPAKRSNLKGTTKPAPSRVSKPAAAQVVLHGEKSAAHTVVVSDGPQADPREIYKAVCAAHTLPQGVWASLRTKGKLVLHSSNPDIIPEVTTSMASKLTGMKVRQQKKILPRICLFRVDEETSNSTIEETFLETAAVSKLPGEKVVRVAHRSAPRNGTCTAFIEVDLKTFGALGVRGRIVVDGVILNFEESIRARVCFRCCGFGHNSAQCTRAPSHEPNKMKKNIPCRYCATFHEHNKQKCPAWNQTCRKCNKKNHWAKVCKSRMRTVQSLESQNSNDEQEDCYSLEYVSEISARKLMTKLELELNGYKESIICQIDTGATVNVLNFADLCKIMQDGNPSLKPSYIKLRCYGGEILKPRGQIKINCTHQSKQHPIVFQVIDHWEKPILSAETCQKLNLIEIKADLCKIESTWTKQNNLLDKYKDIFEGIGCLQGEYKLETDPTIKPIKQAPRRVPITLRKELKEKLIDMEKKNIIAKVDYPTDWISNLVLVKSTKKLRICIDPRELNVALKRAEYPIPTIEEIIPNLQNAKIFTVVDTKDGFWNVKLSDESSNLTTFWTPFGRYKFLRMPFGLKTASEEYQRRLYEIFQGLEGIEIIADDILILGKGDSYEEALKDHDRNLENLFKTARQANLKFNINKVKLRLKEVKYLGHIITPHGLKPDPEKVKALKEMPHPESITELKSFLGFATYLCKFMPNISMISEPLRKLTMKNSTWSWSKNHQAAFEQIKDLASKAPILRYFDADKSIAIQCVASKHGLGATLLQESQSIIFASRSLSKTEQNYAQIEKECLAIVFACERFHQYILGKCQVIVQTDHKPLLTIFKKSILKAPQRLQRMLLRLQRYNLELEHVQGSQMHLADIFSRACIKDVRNENLKYDVYPIDIIYKEIATVNVMETLSVCSDTVLRIREETSSDPIPCEVKKLILNGWPPNKNQTSMLTREYWNFREELTVQDGIILKNDRIVIPNKLRAEMIMKTHQGHIGINSSMRRARDNIFWPGMNAQIGQEIENCSICLSNSQNQVREPMKSHKIPNYPWERIYLDIFEIFKQNYLIIVDHYSDFFEVECLENTTSEYIIECCKRQFSRYGIPQIIVSDNGRQFKSTEFQKFSKEWQFQHSTSSPLHSQGNGKAEAAVKIAKNLLKKSKQENSDFWQNLLNWRNTPTIDIDSSPVQRIMSRRTRAILPIHPNLLKPSIPENIPDKISIKRQQAKYYYDRKSKNLPDLDIGQEVYVRTPNTTPSWSKANITNEHNTRSYDVNIHGRTYRRNRTWIKPQQASANQKSTNNQEEGRKESIDQEQTVSNCLPSTSSAGGDNI
ncbi:K02A2.6-like, partial [Cordylochernes scorpioides]